MLAGADKALHGLEACHGQVVDLWRLESAVNHFQRNRKLSRVAFGRKLPPWALRIDRIVSGEVMSLTKRTETPLIFGRNGFARFRFRAVGSAPTDLSARLWQDERPEPEDWNVTASDDAPALQAAVSGFRATSFVDPSQSTGPVTFSWDDLVLTNGVAQPLTP